MKTWHQILCGCIGATILFFGWLAWTDWTTKPPAPKVPMESVSVTIWYDATGAVIRRQESKVVHRPEVPGMWERNWEKKNSKVKAGEWEE